ncbi:MAG: hypothetical protein Harvfovirus2_41 [Harvfovirus sp.]|uniref:Uncharacterized protein n=1 Tax=Harvfovirus sp. TaxID=2487768 RepID=A0A3G5A2U0_9VIRU|nr:MAG: hypothetical protein Harvfovirus2_41 [Harvfovirus sp.]
MGGLDWNDVIQLECIIQHALAKLPLVRCANVSRMGAKVSLHAHPKMKKSTHLAQCIQKDSAAISFHRKPTTSVRNASLNDWITIATH